MLLLASPSLSIANAVLRLWQDGYYSPSTGYPYTLLETLQDLQAGAKAKEDYTDHFQPFTPVNEEPAQGNRQVAAGIVKHPETTSGKYGRSLMALVFFLVPMPTQPLLREIWKR
jgi:hypothetical protein